MRLRPCKLFAAPPGATPRSSSSSIPVLRASLLPPDSQLHRTFPSCSREPRLRWALAKFWLSPGRWAPVLGAPKAHLLEEIGDFRRLWGRAAGRALAAPVRATEKLRKAQMAGVASPGAGRCSVAAFASCPGAGMQGRSRAGDAVRRRPCSRGCIACLP